MVHQWVLSEYPYHSIIIVHLMTRVTFSAIVQTDFQEMIEEVNLSVATCTVDDICQFYCKSLSSKFNRMAQVTV